MSKFRVTMLCVVSICAAGLAQAEMTRSVFSRPTMPVEKPGATHDQMSQDSLDGAPAEAQEVHSGVMAPASHRNTAGETASVIAPVPEAEIIETYDAETRLLIKEEHPDGTILEFSSENGQPTRAQHPDGVVFTFDPLTAKVTGTQFPENTRKAYDPDSGPTAKTTDKDGIVRTYDPKTGTLLFIERPKTIETTIEDLGSNEIRRIYDPLTQKVVKTIYPNGVVQIRDPYNNQITNTLSLVV